MPTNILGVSAFYHDSAACLVRDGQIVAAAQEERFTRKKFDARFPVNAIRYCLQEARISLADLKYFVFYDKPLIKFERLLETYVAFSCVSGRGREVGPTSDSFRGTPRVSCSFGLLSFSV